MWFPEPLNIIKSSGAKVITPSKQTHLESESESSVSVITYLHLHPLVTKVLQ